MKNIRKLLSVIICFVMIISLTACGESKESKKIDYKENAPLAPTKNTSILVGEMPEAVTIVVDKDKVSYAIGLYVALEKGYFKDNGIKKVKIVNPDKNKDAIIMAANRRVQFAMVSCLELINILGKREDKKITAVTAITQHNTDAICSVKQKKIKNISNLTKKELNIGSITIFKTDLASSIIKKAAEDEGVFIRNKRELNKDLDKRVNIIKNDAKYALIDTNIEGTYLDMDNVKYGSLELNKLKKEFDIYGEMLVSSDAYLNDNKKEVKSVLKAVKKGYEYTIKNPDEALKILKKHVKKVDTDYIKASQKTISKEYISDEKNFGVIDKERWNAFLNWLNINQITNNTLKDNSGFTNDYIK